MTMIPDEEGISHSVCGASVHETKWVNGKLHCTNCGRAYQSTPEEIADGVMSRAPVNEGLLIASLMLARA